MQNSLIFENMTADDRFYWAFVRNRSLSIYGIARISREDGSVHFVLLPFEIKNGWNSFSDLLKVGQKLYLIPKESDYMLVYDLAADEWQRIFIQVPDGKYIYRPVQKFSSAIASKEYLYLLPCFYPTIARYHLQTGEMEYLYECMEELDQYPTEESKGICDQVIENESGALFFSKRYGMILQFEAESCEIKILENFGFQEQFCAFEDDGQSYWLIPYRADKPIVRFDKKEKKSIYLSKEVPGLVSGRAPFSWSVVADHFVWLFPGLANIALKISIDVGTITEAEQFRPSCTEEDGETERWKFRFVKKIKNEIFAFDTTSNELIHYSSPGVCIRERYELSTDDMIRFEYKKISEAIKEKNVPEERQTDQERSQTIGERIYTYLTSI